ncbi:MAG: hypothetical protein K5912_04590 [Alphaproteobacteria bacterium]|nr:hypothetical protein [Alphaproteobacteria bacterium]
MKKPLVFSLFREQSIFMMTIVGIMTFLAVLALGVSLSIGTGVLRWNRQWDLFATVQVTNQSNTKIVQKILDDNRSRFTSARELTTQEMTDLIRPWISDGNSVLKNYLPQMYEIKFKSNSDVKTFNSKIAPYARMLTHTQALNPSISAGWKMVFISGLVLALIIAAIGICISFIARNTAVLHKRELEILNQVGASDAFVVRQMQIIVTKICMVAGAAGFIVAAPVLLLIIASAHSARVGLMAMMGLSGTGWLLLMLMPVAIVIFAIYITKRTTMNILKHS